MTTPRYHHGALRPALLDAALEAISELGPTALSMRDVARRAGVSHAASAHHFGDKAGLLTALAAQGYDLLADELAAAWADTGRFLEVGVAYVRFAVAHPAHFAVMFRPELLHLDDPALRAAKARSDAALYGGVEQVAALPSRDRSAGGRGGRLVDRARLRVALARRRAPAGPRRGPGVGRPCGRRPALPDDLSPGAPQRHQTRVIAPGPVTLALSGSAVGRALGVGGGRPMMSRP